MTAAFARILRRSKTESAPEYLPPYFWHRYWVCTLALYLLNTTLLLTVGAFWDGFTFWWKVAATCALYASLFRLTERVRAAWVKRTLRKLTGKLDAWLQQDATTTEDAHEAYFRLVGLSAHLYRYRTIVLHPKGYSVRLISWEGSGTKFALYERGKPKKEVTFYHD